MNTKTTLPISQARSKIFDIAEEVQKPDSYFVLTEKGRPKVVILSAEEFDSMLETLDILSDPHALQDIKKAEEEYRRGEYVTLDEFRKQLKRGKKHTKK